MLVCTSSEKHNSALAALLSLLGHCVPVPRSSLLQGSLENDELRHYYMAVETHSAKGFNEKNII